MDFLWNCNCERFATCGVTGDNLNCVGSGNCLMKRETKQTFVSCSHVCLDLNSNSWFWHRQVRYDLCCLEYCSLVLKLEMDAAVNPETDR